MRPSRWPIRVRLTALYAGAFLAAGVVLVAVTYWLVSRSLNHSDHSDAMRHPAGDHQMAEAAHEAVEAYRSETLNSLLTWSMLALAGALVIAVGLGWFLAGRALRPLHRVTETANRVADRSLHERIALTGPDDEVKQLADTIDEMLERLDRSFDAQRRFVANASHELRTPLAVNRTMLEVALGEPGVSEDLRRIGPMLLATNERSEDLVEGLLTLARSEQQLVERTAIDLADVAAVAVEHEEQAATDVGVTVTTDLEPAPVEGNWLLVERLATNLVQNAVRHSPHHSEAVAFVRTGRRDGACVLEVENPGPALRPDEIHGLFEPFRRGNGRTRYGSHRSSGQAAISAGSGRTSSGGVGLGLSIVRSVARAHGGKVSARPREGGGLIVLVELPSTPGPALRR